MRLFKENFITLTLEYRNFYLVCIHYIVMFVLCTNISFDWG